MQVASSLYRRCSASPGDHGVLDGRGGCRSASYDLCPFGLQNGLERVTKVMMIALLVIMVILAVNSLFMTGG